MIINLDLSSLISEDPIWDRGDGNGNGSNYGLVGGDGLGGFTFTYGGNGLGCGDYGNDLGNGFGLMLRGDRP